MMKEENDLSMLSLLEKDLFSFKEKLKQANYLCLLSGPYDACDAILEIHSGSGGTESCDWVMMLFRMYERWCEKKEFKIEILDELKGEEVGYKSISAMVHGTNAYGYLKNERGVHRLIRLSPFDSGNRRHTTFASVEVTPLFDQNVNVEIKENDLRIDVYRSSGCGGQGVNTTDSAVRITHLPTKIVVTCQNERSQIKNKEIAMEVLKSKLYQLELAKKEQQLKELKGNQRQIDFGSQRRTYVLHPYKIVKDHLTNTENNNAEKVLDGDLDEFIYDNLRREGKDI